MARFARACVCSALSSASASIHTRCAHASIGNVHATNARTHCNVPPRPTASVRRSLTAPPSMAHATQARSLGAAPDATELPRIRLPAACSTGRKKTIAVAMSGGVDSSVYTNARQHIEGGNIRPLHLFYLPYYRMCTRRDSFI